MRPTVTLALAATAALMIALPALADGRQRSRQDGAGYVTAYSRIGNGSVSGPVRRAPLGLEVRLPSGTWIACRHSCSETLRVETIDYWYAHGPNAIANESGIFGTLELHYPR